jgi:hypothetical protein
MKISKKIKMINRRGFKFCNKNFKKQDLKKENTKISKIKIEINY